MVQIAEFRRRPEEAIGYLNACFEIAFEENEPELALLALGKVAKAFGMSKLAKQARFKRESLHRMLSGRGNPEWNSMFRVMKALNVRPRFEPTGRAGA